MNHSSPDQSRRSPPPRKGRASTRRSASARSNSSTRTAPTRASPKSTPLSPWRRRPGLDLVEIAPNSVPPVCKILDYGKYKYQAQKKAAEARKKQKVVEIKEIKLRPMIDDHDYEVKMRSMQRFFEEGDKVKVTLRFRGREMAHQELGYKLLDRVKGDTAEDRQDRAGAPLRRPPGGHGPGAALAAAGLRSHRRQPAAPATRAFAACGTVCHFRPASAITAPSRRPAD